MIRQQSRTPPNYLIPMEKDFLLHRVLHDLSTGKKDYQPIKRVKTPNTGYFYGKRAKSNENAPKTPIMHINEKQFLLTQQLFVGPMKENEMKLEKIEKKPKNEELKIKVVKIPSEKNEKDNGFSAKNVATQKILSFFNENQQKDSKEQKFFEKLPKINKISNFKPYKEEKPLMKKNQYKFPEKKPEKEPISKKKINISKFFNEIDKCGCWSIQSSVSVKLNEDF